MTYSGMGALARAELAAEVLRDRLRITGLDACRVRIDLIGTVSTFDSDAGTCAGRRRRFPPDGDYRVRLAGPGARSSDRAGAGERGDRAVQQRARAVAAARGARSRRASGPRRRSSRATSSEPTSGCCRHDDLSCPAPRDRPRPRRRQGQPLQHQRDRVRCRRRIRPCSTQVTPERVHGSSPIAARRGVRRYELPRLAALNLVIDDVLEGGVNGSLNLDGHGKTLAYHLLSMEVEVPPDVLEAARVRTGPLMADRPALDVMRLEVLRNRFTAIAEEMSVVLQRAAFSTNIKTRLDHSCALLDAEGRVIAQSFGQPAHLGTLVHFVPSVLRDFGETAAARARASSATTPTSAASTSTTSRSSCRSMSARRRSAGRLRRGDGPPHRRRRRHAGLDRPAPGAVPGRADPAADAVHGGRRPKSSDREPDPAQRPRATRDRRRLACPDRGREHRSGARLAS